MWGRAEQAGMSLQRQAGHVPEAHRRRAEGWRPWAPLKGCKRERNKTRAALERGQPEGK